MTDPEHPTRAVAPKVAVARPSAQMTSYALLLTALCLAIIGLRFPSQHIADALFWIPLIAVANLYELSILPEVELDLTLGPRVIVAAAVLNPPSAVVLFALVGYLHRRELRGEAPLVMSLFNRSMHALSGAAASATAVGVYAAGGGTSWQIVPAVLIAGVSYEIVNTGLLAAMFVVRRGRSWRQALAESTNPIPRFALNAAVSGMLSVLVAVLVRDVGRWSVVLVVLPLWLSHSAQRSARVAQDRAEELAARVLELEMLNRLSGELLSVHDTDVVAPVAGEILSSALDGGAVMIDLAGDASDGARVGIPGAPDASIVLTDERDDASDAVLEAAASLIGLTLTRLEVEAELAETERARTALTGRILEEATHERSRIAMSMHDDVLPLFAAAQMQIDNAEMLLQIDDSERAMDVIEQATSGVSDGIRSLRDTLESLRESTLVPGTVVDGARRLLADLRTRTGIRSKLEAPDPLPLPFAVELLAYETLRGCLANVEKHSHATMVHVEFRADDGRLVLLMRDDGRGFDPTTIGKRSHGLALMRQRAELARGSFDITGAPGAGSTARLEVPTW